MVSAVLVTTILEYPNSPLHELLPDAFLRRVLTGLSMGLTAIAIIYSPLGKRSGAHLNPAVTLTFFRLGKLESTVYLAAQFIGGLIGLMLVAAAIGAAIEHPSVNYVVTVPGNAGTWLAFAAEAVMSFWMMLVVLIVSNSKTLNVWTGCFAGTLVATFIIIEAQLSGMSINPARTVASAVPAHLWTDRWIYLTAPFIGMLLAAECYVRTNGIHQVLCAKLHHHNHTRCIFHCHYMA